MELTSTYTTGDPQPDGRYLVKERHVASDGQIVEFEYLAGARTDPELVMSERAKIVLERLETRADALAQIAGTTVPITKYQFVSRMTPEEAMAIIARAKTDIRAEYFLKIMEWSGNVNLKLASPGLQLFVELGDLTAERAEIIGAE